MILFLSLLQFSRQSQFKSSSSVFVCFLFMFCDMFVIYYCTLLLVIFLCSQSLSFPKIQFSFHLFYPSCEILLLNSVTSGFDWHISSSYEAVYRSTSLDSMNNKTKHETRHTWLHKETTSLRSHNAPPTVFCESMFLLSTQNLRWRSPPPTLTRTPGWWRWVEDWPGLCQTGPGAGCRPAVRPLWCPAWNLSRREDGPRGPRRCPQDSEGLGRKRHQTEVQTSESLRKRAWQVESVKVIPSLDSDSSWASFD